MRVNTDAADGDLIEQFKDDMQQYDCVEAVYACGGVEVKVKVKKNDRGAPDPRRDEGELVDGHFVMDDYAVGNLSGSGSSPGGYYVRRCSVTPKCDDCGTGQGTEVMTDGDVVCWSCYKDRGMPDRAGD